MTEISPVTLHALQMAMKSELDTVRIYKKMLKKVKNGQSREFLQRLIDEEFAHENRVKEKLLGYGGSLPEGEDLSDVPSREHLLELELEHFSCVELINIAIENEKISRDFYQHQISVAESAEVKDVFTRLMEEENTHIQKLQDELQHNQSTYDEADHAPQ